MPISPENFWPEALAAACYITNRLPTKSLGGMTPYEAWYGEKPDLSGLKVYGCDAYVVDYQAKSSGKMAPRSWAGTLVGYEGKNQWRIWNGTRVVVRRDVVFNEAKLTFKKSPDSADAEPVGDDSMENVDLTDLLQSVGVRNTDLHQPNAEPDQPIRAPDQAIEPMPPMPEDGDNEDVAPVPEDQNQGPPAPAENAENPATELATEATLPNPEEPLNPLIMTGRRNKVRHDYKQLHTRGFAKSAKPVIAAPHQIATPSTYEEAISGPQANQWKKAMQAEYDSQVERGTFQIASLPYDQKAIGGKWVFKLKENPDGTIARYKARWVAKGYRQIEGRDFDETYAPVVRSDTSRMMLAIASVLGYQIRQFDIKTAFLYGQMD
jgi:hypothetical protein